MGKVSSHPPGNFCWFELGTTDWQAGRKFYSSLFGWSVNELPMGDNEPPYLMFQKSGGDVAALYQQKKEQIAQDIPPCWMPYVCVNNAADTASKAKKLGATVMVEPFDVFDFGRMAVMMDPQGAAFSVWQRKTHVGATVIDEPGAVCWSELQTSDVAAAKKFYTSLFGWGTKQGGDYTEWQNGGKSIGGAMKSQAAGVPPFWITYFMVDHCDAATKKAQSLGAQVHVKPMDVENVGRFSVLMDPQGAAFSLIKLANA